MATLTDNAIAARLLDSAVRLFADKGYPATSTREIVESAGVTKPMLYYYFQSKEGLLAAALAHFINPFHERLRQVVVRRLNAHEMLIELVWAHLDFCQANQALARLFYTLYFGPEDQHGLVDLEQYAEQGHELLMRAVTQAKAARLIRAGSEEDFGMALHGMINIWVMAALRGEAELNRGVAKRVVDNLLRGYKHSDSR